MNLPFLANLLVAHKLQIFAANLLGLGALKKVRLHDLIIAG